MIKIEVKSTEIESFSGTSKSTGKPFTIRNQMAYAFLLDKAGNARPYPELIKLSLEDNQLPFPVGFYQLAPQSVFVDKFDRLALGRPSLLPMQISQARAA